jgi:hypothetical protein
VFELCDFGMVFVFDFKVMTPQVSRVLFELYIKLTFHNIFLVLGYFCCMKIKKNKDQGTFSFYFIS